jgi:hypothetical protein
MTQEEIEAEFAHLGERLADRGFVVLSWHNAKPPAVWVGCVCESRGIRFEFFREYQEPCWPELVEPRFRMLAGWMRLVIRRIDEIDAAEEAAERLRAKGNEE